MCVGVPKWTFSIFIKIKHSWKNMYNFLLILEMAFLDLHCILLIWKSNHCHFRHYRKKNCFQVFQCNIRSWKKELWALILQWGGKINFNDPVNEPYWITETSYMEFAQTNWQISCCVSLWTRFPNLRYHKCQHANQLLRSDQHKHLFNVSEPPF